MFAMTLQGGVIQGFPDVCKTPGPVGPIPIPYPNIVNGATADGNSASKKVFFASMEAMHLKTKWDSSNGDEPGTAGGVVSNVNMNKVQFLKGSMKVQIEGNPAVRLCDPTKHNGSNPNAMGNCLSPSQTDVMILE